MPMHDGILNRRRCQPYYPEYIAVIRQPRTPLYGASGLGKKGDMRVTLSFACPTAKPPSRGNALKIDGSYLGSCGLGHLLINHQNILPIPSILSDPSEFLADNKYSLLPFTQ